VHGFISALQMSSNASRGTWAPGLLCRMQSLAMQALLPTGALALAALAAAARRHARLDGGQNPEPTPAPLHGARLRRPGGGRRWLTRPPSRPRRPWQRPRPRRRRPRRRPTRRRSAPGRRRRSCRPVPPRRRSRQLPGSRGTLRAARPARGGWCRGCRRGCSPAMPSPAACTASAAAHGSGHQAGSPAPRHEMVQRPMLQFFFYFFLRTCVLVVPVRQAPPGGRARGRRRAAAAPAAPAAAAARAGRGGRRRRRDGRARDGGGRRRGRAGRHGCRSRPPCAPQAASAYRVRQGLGDACAWVRTGRAHAAAQATDRTSDESLDRLMALLQEGKARYQEAAEGSERPPRLSHRAQWPRLLRGGLSGDSRSAAWATMAVALGARVFSEPSLALLAARFAFLQGCHQVVQILI